jgi:NAD(P)-dependent dehydrogenase (short-subunit alcohol dehydrogenase family)
MRDVEGKTAFITGAASGVGLGMAKVFRAAGMRVAMADIREERVREAAERIPGYPDDVLPVQLDVTDRERFAAVADEVEAALGNVHVVCNNAGVNLFNDIAFATYQDWDWIMGVNLGGAINGVVTWVPRLTAHGEGGHIVNTASMAAIVAGPGAGIYTASKFGVRGLSEALQYSLRPLGIGVSVLCPGLVDSRIYESDDVRPQELATDTTPADATIMQMLPQLHHSAGMPGEEVAEKVLRAIRNGDFYVFSHPDHRDEVREIFDEIVAAFPDEQAPEERMAFENSRRAAAKAAREAWPEL